MPTFTVPGTPATKGSTVSFVGKGGKVVTKADCKRLGSWSEAVAWSAKAAKVRLIEKPHPVQITVCFVLQRPQTPNGRLYPTVKPDLDKTLRACLDALTGVAYDDDAQVIRISTVKVYGQTPYTEITIDEVVG
jgi:crossover junction endodeoxyribonuclease RusA